MTDSGPRTGPSPQSVAPAHLLSPARRGEDVDPRLAQAESIIGSLRDELQEVDARAMQAELQSELAKGSAELRLSAPVLEAQRLAESVIDRAREQAARRTAGAEASLVATRAQCRHFVRHMQEILAPLVTADREVAEGGVDTRRRLLVRLQELERQLGEGENEHQDDGAREEERESPADGARAAQPSVEHSAQTDASPPGDEEDAPPPAPNGELVPGPISPRPASVEERVVQPPPAAPPPPPPPAGPLWARKWWARHRGGATRGVERF